MRRDIEVMMNPNASYRDLTGTAQLAWDLERTALNSLAEKSGIDTKVYEPVGISLHIAGPDFFSLSIFIADREIGKNEKRRIRDVMTEIKFKDFQKTLKELSLNLFPRSMKWEEEFFYEGETRISEL